MNERDLMKALSDIDEDLILGAEQSKQKTAVTRRLLSLAAACLCVVMLGGLYALWGVSPGTTQDTNSVEKADGIPAYASMEETAEFSLPYGNTAVTEGNGDQTQMWSAIDANDILGHAATTEETGAETLPEDFSVVISWESGDHSFRYDSAAEQITIDGNLTEELLFSEELAQLCWSVTTLPEDSAPSEGAVDFRWTAAGERGQRYLDLSQYDSTSVSGQLAAALLEQLEGSLTLEILESMLPTE